MVCIKCGKEINKSYASPEFDGNYCFECAYKLGYTSIQMAKDNLNKALQPLRKTATSVLKGVEELKKHLPPAKENDKCEGCIRRGEYQDMGATTPICKNGRDLDEAVKMRRDPNPCKSKVTWREIDEFVKQRTLQETEKAGRECYAPKLKAKFTVIDEPHEILTVVCPYCGKSKFYVGKGAVSVTYTCPNCKNIIKLEVDNGKV